ncbi:PREDICTED: protein FAM114A2 [Bactrocera latifrons]|uniref:Protein FAM114A2 n=1 Tax=Bactrocera latifrons TaxID=174628 RepID=A0A0K8U169_BACLA|nr:PREDICTED: protein FAM114A2 [Bactrocera latifrons]
MSTKIDSKNINNTASEKNDWDENDDDDWDDWGDAEENFKDTPGSNMLEDNVAKGNINAENNNLLHASKKTVEETTQDFNKNKGKVTEVRTTENIITTTTQKPTSGWGGLFGGVVSSVLSTASEGIGNITSTMSQGLNQVIGVPDPEELARMQATETAKQHSELKDDDNHVEQKVINDNQQHRVQEQQEGTPSFGLNIVSGVTTLGSKVLNTGLDTLEGIGKKTMHILQENDPLLMNKRKLLGLEQDKPNLSEVLKEAKKDADHLENALKEMKLEKSREMLRFDLLFENNCGLVHLEALEILSKESVLKLQKLQDAVSGNALKELQETIAEVKELMELEDLEGESDGDYDVEELNTRLISAIEDAELQINFEDIISNWRQALELFKSAPVNGTYDTVQECFAKAITLLAEACALQINKLHKIAELLLVKEHHSTANEVDCIVQLCKQFTMHLNGLTNRFAATLTGIQLDAQTETDDIIKTRISTLFAEMLVAIQQIEKAFHLFLPILQIGAV